jgi:hypothetical protein
MGLPPRYSFAMLRQEATIGSNGRRIIRVRSGAIAGRISTSGPAARFYPLFSSHNRVELPDASLETVGFRAELSVTWPPNQIEIQ